MALAKMSFDELNQLVGHKVSEPFDEYFAPMRISEEQKKQRIRLAEHLYDVFLGLLAEYFYADQLDSIVSSDIFERTRDEYMNIIYLYGSLEVPDEYIINHAESVIADTVAVLLRNREKPYFYSDDRAMAIAEEESNVVWEYTEYAEAVKNKRFKTWHTIMDGHERESHAEVNGMTLPISEPFLLRGGYLQFPGDDSLGVSDEELVSCRCSLSFS